ncbi:hypothetical protein IMX26_10775 [Clostridium sp. 'deep sea']|uniref:hypothetical protein n=1 Tax=Clostridium sp. 'deep sea' TaxID=2779445 RepID=UPI0018963FD1|nr:hypothetical protein [Clostridium sp. 'deep sea']QOR33976.1 hypothetical protein IMX26_10775 [Clostridium sp. 'deep sea']
MAKITVLTPTVCELMQVVTPKTTQAHALPQVLGEAKNLFKENPVEKCLIYAPDALGSFLLNNYTAEFNKVKEIAPITADLEAVMKTYTPVCFASMFSGALPETTGIKKYEKPVLTVETMFDVLAKAGKKVALVAVKDCSIDIIFRGRDIEYYSEPYDLEVTNRTIELLKQNELDVIVAYNQEYDDLLHRTKPFSTECINAMHNHLKTFNILAQAFNKYWAKYNRVIAFTPDHGAHLDTIKNKGNHGTDMPEDLNVRHYWGLYKKQE